MLLVVLVFGEVHAQHLHGLLIKKVEEQVGLDHYLKIMQNTDLVCSKQIKREEKN